MSALFAHVRRRRAATVALVVVMLPILLGMAALAIDIGYLSAMGAQFQNAADAGALAGVRELPDEWRALQIARRYTRMNVNGETVLGSWWEPPPDDSVETDVQVGNWHEENQAFIGQMEPINAIKVVVRRNEKLMFGSILGMSDTTLEGVSIALAAGANCLQTGITAGGFLSFQQDTTLDNYCVYGRDGVHFKQDARLLNDSEVGALDAATITWEPTAVGLPELITESDTKPTLAWDAAQFVNDLEAGYWPDQILNMVVAGSLPAPSALTEGTLYIINGNVTVAQNADFALRNVIIAVRGNLLLKEDGTIRNVGFEGTDDAAIGILATGDILVEQNAVIDNANLVAGNDVHIKQDGILFKASIQAGRNVQIDQDPQLIGDFKSAFGAKGAVASAAGVGQLVK